MIQVPTQIKCATTIMPSGPVSMLRVWKNGNKVRAVITEDLAHELPLDVSINVGEIRIGSTCFFCQIGDSTPIGCLMEMTSMKVEPDGSRMYSANLSLEAKMLGAQFVLGENAQAIPSLARC